MAEYTLVNPARAGMILQDSPSSQISAGKPRASGDDPAGGNADPTMLK